MSFVRRAAARLAAPSLGNWQLDVGAGLLAVVVLAVLVLPTVTELLGSGGVGLEVEFLTEEPR